MEIIIVDRNNEVRQLVTSNGVPQNAIGDIIGNEDGFGDCPESSIVADPHAWECKTTFENFEWWQSYLDDYCA